MMTSFALKFFNSRRSRMQSRRNKVEMKKRQQVLKLVRAPLSLSPCISSAF